MKKILCIFLFLIPLFGATGERLEWSSGLSLLAFLEKNQLPSKLYYNLSASDKELASEVAVGSSYYILRDHKRVLQVLIPISEDVQMHIYWKNGQYFLWEISSHTQESPPTLWGGSCCISWYAHPCSSFGEGGVCWPSWWIWQCGGDLSWRWHPHALCAYE